MIRPVEQKEPIKVEDIVFDSEYSESNPCTDEEEYEALRLSISKIGQQDAVIRYFSDGKWLCGDGRHRVKACKELGIAVLVRDIASGTPRDKVALIMLASDNNRNVTATQKAIKAYRRIERYPELSIKEVCGLIGIRNNLVTYVRTITKYEQSSKLETLFQGKKVNIGSLDVPKWSNSLEVVAKWSKATWEESRLMLDEERIEWNPDAKITTEAGKAWYYETVKMYKIGEIGERILIGELANYKFKLREGVIDGE